jgi:hypothetical protein
MNTTLCVESMREKKRHQRFAGCIKVRQLHISKSHVNYISMMPYLIIKRLIPNERAVLLSENDEAMRARKICYVLLFC